MEELGLAPGQLDLLAGCPPCQGFSSMRTLNGKRRIRDPQNDLLFDFMRFVHVLKPRAVMLENVPGLATNWRLKKFVRRLTGLGYHHQARILDAANFGVPQRRRRFILIATLTTKPRFAEPDEKRVTVRVAIGHLPKPGSSGDPCHDLPEQRTERVAALIRRIPKDGGSRAALGERSQLACHRKVDGFKDVYGRMRWDDVAPTITGGCINPSKGRFLHPTQHRTVTLREAAVLQTFPRTYWFALDRGKFSTAQLIGNALPPEFIRRHAIEVKRGLRQRRT
jgi:DNA (cytosine-5)-methyltransferase 1